MTRAKSKSKVTEILQKDSCKKEYITHILIPVILAAILSSVGTYLVTSSFQEKYVDLTSAGSIKNDSFILKIHNDAERHSTSDLTIFGLVGGEKVAIKRILGEILAPGKDMVIEIPLQKQESHIEFEKYEEGSYMQDWAKEFDDRSEEIDNELLSGNILAYQIECKGCKNDDKWEFVIFSFSLGLSIGCYECKDIENACCGVSYDTYQWIPG